MAFNNFPTIIQPAFQQNMLDRRWQAKLNALNVYRKSAYVLPIEKRSGETMIYSRAGRISPVLSDIVGSNLVPPDMGATAVGIGANSPAFPMEQFLVNIGMLEGAAIDLNLVQDELIIASMFGENSDNLAEQAGLSLDLVAAQTGFKAYEGGSTYAIATANSGQTSIYVDNVYGFDTAFQQVTINGNTFSTGLPAPTSPTNPLAAKCIHANGSVDNLSIVGVTLDSPTNNSSMAANGLNTGWSGHLTTAANLVNQINVGDTIVAFDGSVVLRPNGKLNRSQLQPTDTIGAQLIINAVAQLRRNGIKPPNGMSTYPCYIDPVVDAQFFTDNQYQIMSQTNMNSPDFKGARVAENFGVTFVPTTNAPAYVTSSGQITRRAIVCGEKWLQESPFAGVESAVAAMPDQSVSDIRLVNKIAFVTRIPIDRAGMVLSQMWWYIGGFVAPTQATINSFVIPTATASRYKSAVVVEVASAS